MKRSVELFRRDLHTLLGLPESVHRRLDSFAITAPIDVEEVTGFIETLPEGCAVALIFLLSLDEEPFQALVEDLGPDGDAAAELRNRLFPMRPITTWLRKQKAGMINSWTRMRQHSFYEPLDRQIWLDMELRDDLDNVVFHARAPLHRFVGLANTLVQVADDVTVSFAATDARVAGNSIDRVRERIQEIEDICDVLSRHLSELKRDAHDAHE